MGKISVKYSGGMSFEASARNHKVAVDLPLGLGGEDAGPTPVELFAISLASCTGIELAFYCKKFNWDPTGLKIEVTYEKLPDRIKKISLEIFLPSAKSEKEFKEAIGWAKKCLINNTLHYKPEIETILKETTDYK
ncbi:MAG: OsmC family protein [Candidatus Omnitrophota bacterium]